MPESRRYQYHHHLLLLLLLFFITHRRPPHLFHRAPTMASPPAHVLIFPFPAAGHMNPLLDLAHVLSQRGLPITILVTPKNVPLLQPLLSRSPSISTLVLPFPPHPSIPPGIEDLRSLPPHLFPSMIQALEALHLPLLSWARSPSAPPLSAIISDFFLGWTRSTAAELGIPRLVFCPSPAIVVSIVNHLWKNMPEYSDEEETFSFPSLPRSPTYHWYQLSPIYRAYRRGYVQLASIKQGFLDNIASWGCVFNSCEFLEGEYLEVMRSDVGGRRVWAVGPLLDERDVAGGDLLTWLDGKREGSVVYVCFGSQVTLKAPQAAAVAAALERSGAPFIWVAGKSAEIPPEFEERAAARGRVVRGWAPQRDILRHPAVGSFFSHCGWNSVVEGIIGGVFFLTWPMTADQFINERLLEELGVGMRACERMDGVPDADELALAVARSVDGSPAQRAAVAELRRKAEETTRDGGDSDRQIGDLVEVLGRLGQKTSTSAAGFVQ